MMNVFTYLEGMKNNNFNVTLQELLNIKAHRIVLNRDLIIGNIIKLDGEFEEAYLNVQAKQELLCIFAELVLKSWNKGNDVSEFEDYVYNIVSEYGYKI